MPLKNSHLFKVKISSSEGEESEERQKRRKLLKESPRSISDHISNLIVKKEDGKRGRKFSGLPQIFLRRKGAGETLEA